MTVPLVIFVFFGLGCVVKADSPPLFHDDESEAYYWRRYLGTIPHDAIAGGIDQNDKVTYIGQTYFETHTIPGEIHDSVKTMYFELNGPRTTTTNIKILCSRYPELFEWIKVTEKNFKFLWSKHIIQGGYYSAANAPFLIGRVLHHNKQLIVGDVLPRDKDIDLYYTSDGIAYNVKNDIELLSFNGWLRCKAGKQTSISERSKIIDVESDVRPKGFSSVPGCINKLFNIQFN